MTNEVVTYQERVGALSVTDVRAQVNLIQHVMREVMKKDEHYGVIPGTGSKPTLLKAGAEKLVLTFRFDPQYEITEKWEGSHLTVMSKCTIYHIQTGQRFGSGMGSCSTKESKYAYRQSSRKCPNCGKEAIIKGKDFKNDGRPTGWVCFGKKGGCGTKFKDGDQAIEGQSIGRVPNEDLADQYNTVLKMANKRSLVAAVLNCTAASDIFTQDIEDTAREVPSDTYDHDHDASGNLANPAPQSGPPPDAAPLAAGVAGPAFETRDATLTRLCKVTLTNKLDLLARAGVSHADEMSDPDYMEAVGMLQRKANKLADRAQA